jgi:hypothetical protein
VSTNPFSTRSTRAPGKRGRRRIAVELRERHLRYSEVAGIRLVEQPRPEDECRELKRRLFGGDVERGERDQVPQPLDRARGLAVRAEPAPERLLVEPRIGGVERAQRGDGARGARPVERREMPVAEQRAGQVQRRGEPTPVERRGSSARREHLDPQPGLQREPFLDAEAAQEPPVARAAAERYVLAVVEPVAVPFDREGRTAELRARLEQRHRRSGVGAVERRRDPGQPAADDRHSQITHESAPARLRARTRRFSHDVSDTRLRSARAGSSAIRSASRR